MRTREGFSLILVRFLNLFFFFLCCGANKWTDFAIQFPLEDEILFLATLSDADSSQNLKTSAYCIQTKNVQKYSFDSSLSNPVGKEELPFLNQGNQEGSPKKDKGVSKAIPAPAATAKPTASTPPAPVSEQKAKKQRKVKHKIKV